ncbi:hypothetical protein [Marinifilum fragile]|uniref:hypothetical protein n=1 Tax=Marinifilum fragile TaxID=570161 RepID=UPI002AA72C68|nr:hypothetical protein [Marinifilum fragile]
METFIEVMKYVLGIILIIGSFIAMLFIWIKVTRLLQKKSHHYIIPPTPKEDKNWKPIDFYKYKCFIFIKDSSIDNLNRKLNRYRNSKQLSMQKIESCKQGNWVVLRVKAASFHRFKSFVWRIDDYSESYETTNEVIGFCQHKETPSEDYVFKVDNESVDGYFIGSFRTGKNFGIYLPHANSHISGNISLSSNQEINFDYEVSELPMECINV